MWGLMVRTTVPALTDRVTLPGAGVGVGEPLPNKEMFSRYMTGRALPDWASEFDAVTWPRFFLKFVLANSAVTVVTPATGKPGHMIENVGGGIGRLPDEATRRRMAEFTDASPSA